MGLSFITSKPCFLAKILRLDFWKWDRCLGTSFPAQQCLYFVASYDLELGTPIIKIPFVFRRADIFREDSSKFGICSSKRHIITVSTELLFSLSSFVFFNSSIPATFLAILCAELFGSTPITFQSISLHFARSFPVPQPISNTPFFFGSSFILYVYHSYRVIAFAYEPFSGVTVRYMVFKFTILAQHIVFWFRVSEYKLTVLAFQQ